jgi:hypothetical protein
LRLIQAEKQQRLLRFGLRQHFQRHIGQQRQRAERAGDELGEIIAGDVLHHAPARLHDLAASGDAVKAEKVIARRARLDAARPGRIDRDHAADRRGAGFTAEKQRMIHRLESELLPIGVEQRQDVAQRRAGAGREHQLLRFVERHARERPRGKFPWRRRVAAETPLRTRAANAERLVARGGGADRLGRVRGVANVEGGDGRVHV